MPLRPPFELGDTHEQAPADPNHAQIGQHVALEMIATHAQGERRLVDG